MGHASHRSQQPAEQDRAQQENLVRCVAQRNAAVAAMPSSGGNENPGALAEGQAIVFEQFCAAIFTYGPTPVRDPEAAVVSISRERAASR